jgi:hypothetical protein
MDLATLEEGGGLSREAVRRRERMHASQVEYAADRVVPHAMALVFPAVGLPGCRGAGYRSMVFCWQPVPNAKSPDARCAPGDFKRFCANQKS